MRYAQLLPIVLLGAGLAGGCSDEESHLEASLAETRHALAARKHELRNLNGRYESAQGSLEEQSARLERVPGTLDLRVAFEFAGEPLELEKSYQRHGDKISIGSLRYWLTNIALRNQEGEWIDVPDSFYLMEHTTKLTDRMAENPEYVPKLRDSVALRGVPAGSYDAVRFYVGVDPEHNDDLTRTGGELNVLSNMAQSSWMWFTSYIFTSLYGHMTPSTFLEGEPEVVLGWQSGGNDDLRSVELELPGVVQVGFERQASIALALDTSRLFEYLTAQVIEDAQVYPDTPSSYIGPSDETQRTILVNNWPRAFLAREACCGE